MGELLGYEKTPLIASRPNRRPILLDLSGLKESLSSTNDLTRIPLYFEYSGFFVHDILDWAWHVYGDIYSED